MSHADSHGIRSYLRGRLNAQRVDLLPDGRYRLVWRSRGVSADAGPGGETHEWAGTLDELCRRYSLDKGRVTERGDGSPLKSKWETAQ